MQVIDDIFVSHVNGAYRDIFEQYQISVERVIDYERKSLKKKKLRIVLYRLR